MRAALAVVLYVAVAPLGALSCSRVLFNEEGYPVLSARTLDWMWSFEDTMMVIPRGSNMDGGVGLSHAHTKTWTVKYASLTVSINTWASSKVSSFTGKPFDYEKDGATEGINEAGLAAHLLYLEATSYPALSGPKPHLSYFRWVRYLLDTCGTVQEAVAAMSEVQIANVLAKESPDAPGLSFGTHLTLEDASGDSAIFEVMNGSLRTYHGRSAKYTVMTNDPPFPQQLENLERYLPFTRVSTLPGDIASTSRFVRLRYFLNYMPKTQDAIAMAGYLRTVIMTAIGPQGAPATDDPEHGVYPTWWTSIIDFKERLYYFGWMMNPNFFWVNMKRLEAQGMFRTGQPTLYLNPRDLNLVGDVSTHFKPNIPSLAAELYFSYSIRDSKGWAGLALVALLGAAVLGVAAVGYGVRATCAARGKRRAYGAWNESLL